MPHKRDDDKKRIIYSLKAACSHCGSWGTIDDMTLVCFRCGKSHAASAKEIAARNVDIALQRQAETIYRGA